MIYLCPRIKRGFSENKEKICPECGRVLVVRTTKACPNIGKKILGLYRLF